MKNFIFKTTLFLLGGLILVHALASVADNLAADGNTLALLNDQRHIQRLLLAQPQELEAIAIGNSHNGSIDLKTLGYNGYKFTRASSGFFEVQHELEKLLIPSLPEVTTVFVPVSYFSFRWDSAAAQDTRIRRTHMYTVMPTWQFIEGDIVNFIIGKSHLIVPIRSILRQDNWEAIFYAIISGTKAKQTPVEIAENNCHYMSVEDLNEYIGSRVSRQMRLMAEMAANHPNLETDVFQTIVEIIQYLQARNIRVIFFTPPYFEAYNDLYQLVAPETIAQMQQNMQILQRDHGVEYYDFSTDKEFVSSRHLFADGDHLNSCGSRLFSAKFKQVLAENEIMLRTQINP